MPTYKEEFNEHAYNFRLENGRDLSTNDCEEFRSNWATSVYDLADMYRKQSMGEK